MQHDSKKESCFFMKGNKASAKAFAVVCKRVSRRGARTPA